MMRYAQEPFLQYLDGFVLRAIGELTADQEQAIERMFPALATRNGSRPWFEVVAEKMNFKEGYASQIASVWEDSKRSAIEQGVRISPVEFTRLFVDSNFLG